MKGRKRLGVAEFVESLDLMVGESVLRAAELEAAAIFFFFFADYSSGSEMDYSVERGGDVMEK